MITENAFIRKHIGYNIFFVPLGVFLGVLLSIFIYMYLSVYWSVQDVLIQEESSSSNILIDGEKIGDGAVCIPNIRRGNHEIRVTDAQGTVLYEALYFVSDNIVTKKQLYTDTITVQVEPTDCATWTFGYFY